MLKGSMAPRTPACLHPLPPQYLLKNILNKLQYLLKNILNKFIPARSGCVIEAYGNPPALVAGGPCRLLLAVYRLLMQHHADLHRAAGLATCSQPEH